MNCYDAFKKHLDEKEIRYDELDGYAIGISTSTDVINSVRIIVGFGEADSVRPWIKSWSIGTFEGDKYGKALVVCNSMNDKFRWAKFFLNSDKDVVVQEDAVVEEATAGEELFELIVRMLNIMDEAYPEFMKARWA